MTHSRFTSQRRPRCPQCGRVLWVHGARRWWCPRCRRAFTLRPRRRGRKRVRGLHPRTIRRFLDQRQSVRSLQAVGHRSYGATHCRLRRGLPRLARTLAAPEIPQHGSLLVIADAVWRTLRGKRVTLYGILLRPVRSETATLVVLLAREEWECAAGWTAALLELPGSVRRRLVGATIDEHAGLRKALREYGGKPGTTLPIQWCHFHCLAQLLFRLGRKTVRRDSVTGLVWETARRLLNEPRAAARAGLCRSLCALARRSDCPPRTQAAVTWFRRRVPSVTVCFRYPRRRLPATTGTAESVGELLRKFLERVRPRSLGDLQEACRLFQRLHPTVRCTPKLHRNT